MPAFPLAELPPILLKKITTKLEWKSSFRLQLTCRDMEEFVENNRIIKEIYMVTYGNPLVELTNHGLFIFKRYYEFVKTILEFLETESWPHLQRFRLSTSFERLALPYKRQILEEFKDYSPMIETDREIRIQCTIGTIEFNLTMETFYAQ